MVQILLLSMPLLSLNDEHAKIDKHDIHQISPTHHVNTNITIMPNNSLNSIDPQLTNNGSNTIDSCPITNTNGTLEHHIYGAHKWIQRQSDPQPNIQVKVQVCPSDYEALGIPNPPVQKVPTHQLHGHSRHRLSIKPSRYITPVSTKSK